MKLGSVYDIELSPSMKIMMGRAEELNKIAAGVMAVIPKITAFDCSRLQAVVGNTQLNQSILTAIGVRGTVERRSNDSDFQDPVVTEVDRIRLKYDELLQAKDAEIQEKDRVIAELIDMIPEIEEPSG